LLDLQDDRAGRLVAGMGLLPCLALRLERLAEGSVLAETALRILDLLRVAEETPSRIT
jgi:hypothetical protein